MTKHVEPTKDTGDRPVLEIDAIYDAVVDELTARFSDVWQDDLVLPEPLVRSIAGGVRHRLLSTGSACDVKEGVEGC